VDVEVRLPAEGLERRKIRDADWNRFEGHVLLWDTVVDVPGRREMASPGDLIEGTEEKQVDQQDYVAVQ